MASCAIFSPSSTCWLSHSENASCAAPSTKPAAWREDRRSLVCPLNCGSVILMLSTKATRSHTSSGASFTPRGSRLRKSQNSRSASVKPVRRPLTCVPCCAVGNQVDVAFLHQLAFGHPGHGPVGGLGVLGQLADEQLRRQQLAAFELAAQVIAQAILVVPLVAFVAGLVEQLHRQAGAQHRLGAQQVPQRAQVELGRVEVLGIGPEAARACRCSSCRPCRRPPAAWRGRRP